MRLRRTAAIFAIVVGAGMLGIWILQLLTGQAREAQTAPIELTLAIAANCITAIVLLFTGAGLFRAKLWAQKMYLFALGMLDYSVIISSGYFAQQGNFAFVGMFAVLLGASVVLTAVNLRQTATLRTIVHRQLRVP